MIQINKKQLAVVHAARNDDETRYNLNGVYVEKDGTLVATDGRMLLKLQTSRAEDEELSKPVILPKEQVEFARKNMGANGLGCLEVFQKDEHRDKEVQIVAGHGTMDFDPIDGEYPNYLAVFPKEGEVRSEFCIDARLLERLCKAAIEVGGGRRLPVAVKFTVRDPLSPVVAELKAPGAEDNELVGIIMPMRVD